MDELIRANINFFSKGIQREEFIKCNKHRIELILKVLKEIPQEKIADIGCTGGMLAEFYKNLPGIKIIVGFEASEEMSKNTCSLFSEIRIWKAGYTDCPAKDDEFDVIIAGEIIEHILNTDYFLKEVSRILKKGGFVLLTTPNLCYWGNRVRLFIGKVPYSLPSVSSSFHYDAVDPYHIRIGNMDEWRKYFEKMNFKVVKIMGYNYYDIGGKGKYLRKFFDLFLYKKPSLARGLFFILKKL